MNEEGEQIPKPDHVIPPQEKPLRTYESDVADVLAHKNISTTNIAMAENRKRTGNDSIGSNLDNAYAISDGDSPANTKKIILISVASLVLIILGIGGAYYLYNNSALAPQPVTPVAPAPVSILPTDSRVGLPIDNVLSFNIINSVKTEFEKPLGNNTIKEIVLTKTKDTVKYRVGAADALTALNITAPDVLKRSLGDNWMLGVFADNAGNKNAFVLTTVDYFQNAFAGMLQWESVMSDDLKLLLPVDGAIKGSFVDRIVQNKDVREFVTSDGKTLFLYSFIDSTKLVVTSSESTLIEILNRLEQKSYVR